VAARLQTEDRWPLLLAPLVPLVVIALAAAGAANHTIALVAVGGAALIVALLLTAYVDVAWLFSAAIVLTLFSGNWRQLGFPNLVSPDRLMLILAFVVFLLRDPSIGRRPYVRLTRTHAALLVAAAYAVCSAIAAGTIGDRSALAPLIDRFGIVPFLLFLVGPVAFASERQRRILLGTFLAIGAYLGLTGLFEGIGLHALVFPSYIVDSSYGIQPDRARGPFVAAAVEGVALYYCAVAAAVAVATVRQTWVRRLAAAIAALCLFDLIFTLERSIWIGAVVASLIACTMAPALRRYVPAMAVAVAIAVVGALALIPGLHGRASERVSDQLTTWDRLNLNRAAENMVMARPLLGFGAGTFKDRSPPYFQQDPNFPLTNTTGEIHNVFLSNAAELGLVGTVLWLLALLLAVGGAIVIRGPPQLYPWRVGLVAIAVMWLIVSNLVPMVQAFPNQVMWLWAGVVWPWRYAPMRGPADGD
jgi:putative inorganic carbon (HCO3(-)) transporter